MDWEKHKCHNCSRNFSIAEMTPQSELSWTGLARAAGPVNTALGLSFYICKRGRTSKCRGCFGIWTTLLRTIRLLQLKGLSEQSTFAFDWHWRAANLVRGRSNCIIFTWKKFPTWSTRQNIPWSRGPSIPSISRCRWSMFGRAAIENVRQTH